MGNAMAFTTERYAILDPVAIGREIFPHPDVMGLNIDASGMAELAGERIPKKDGLAPMAILPTVQAATAPPVAIDGTPGDIMASRRAKAPPADLYTRSLHGEWLAALLANASDMVDRATNTLVGTWAQVRRFLAAR